MKTKFSILILCISLISCTKQSGNNSYRQESYSAPIPQKIDHSQEIAELQNRISSAENELSELVVELETTKAALSVLEQQRADAEKFVFLRTNSKKTEQLDRIDGNMIRGTNEKTKLEIQIERLKNEIAKNQEKIQKLEND